MHDSYLMGLQQVLLMLLSQTAWERLVRRDLEAGGPRTAPVLLQQGRGEAAPGRGQQAEGPRLPSPASA